MDDVPNRGDTTNGRHPVDLDLEWVLGKMPQKVGRAEPLHSPVFLLQSLLSGYAAATASSEQDTASHIETQWTK